MAYTPFWSRSALWLSLLAVCIGTPAPARADGSLELYGTFHAMGVIVSLDAGDDPDEDAVATVEYRAAGEVFQTGFPPSRIARERFVGSIFWLQPGTVYDVRVSLSDPDGGPLDGQTIQMSMATRAEISIPTPTTDYYVHPRGDGSDCRYDSPCALSTGISQAESGAAVVLRGGTYATGGIVLPRSGSQGAPIVIRGYGGETAVLDGAYQNAFTWAPEGGGVYGTTVDESNVHLVMADGKRLFPYATLGDLAALQWDNTPGMFQDGATLYVHLENGKDPNTASMVVSRHENAFTVEQDHIYFIDLTFKHYGRGAYPKAIYLNNASDNLVRGCEFINNDLGVGLKRESHRNVFEDNVFSDTIFQWPWGGVKAVHRLEDGGITFYDPLTGRGNVIRRNTFHDDFDGMGVCPSDTAALTNETDVYDNVVFRMGDDGMSTDGQCSNVRIWGNTFYDVLIGVSLAPVYGGPVYALNNLIYRTGEGNSPYPGSPFKFNSGYDRSGPMYLFHNTCDAVLPGNHGLHIKTPGSWRLIYSRNNIWAGTENALNNYNTTQPVNMDYDNFFNTGTNDLINWNRIGYATLDQFNQTVPQEANGLNADPAFMDASGGIYELDPGSDLVDAGVYIPGINHDYAGSRPDIGAFEVRPGNHTPMANNDTAVTPEDTTAAIEVLANDRDADSDALSINTCDAQSANGGTVTMSGTTLTYTPAAGFSGIDTFTYTVTDGQEISNTATVTVTVQARNPGGDVHENPPSSDNGGSGSGGCFLGSLPSESNPDPNR